MKRIIFVLSILLAMIFSGCSRQQDPIALSDAVNTIQVPESSVPMEIPTEMPAEVSEPTEIPTEATEPTEMPTEATEPTEISTEPTEMPEEDMDDRKKGLRLGVSAADPENAESSHILPSTFIFANAASWATEITLEEDGTFTGLCSASRFITTEFLRFHGKFSAPQKISEYIYSMNLESLEYDNTSEIVYEEYDYDNKVDVQKTLTVPKGFENAGEFLIYLPGCPLEELPEEYLPECSINTRIRETIPSGVYRLYNVGGNAGFMAEDEDSFWSQTYRNDQAVLDPSYCLKSELGFWREDDFSPSLQLAFDWNYDTQTQFVAKDRKGTGTYNIIFDYSEDYQSLTVIAKNTTVFDLEPWGGTADGTISAEFPVNNRLPFDFLETEQEATSVFSMLPSQFHHGGMGAGGWRSYIWLNEDGTFTGEYSGGVNGAGLPYVPVSLSRYSGQFTEPQKISDYVYSMKIESLEYEETPDTVYFEGNLKYSMSTALDDTSEFRIYLPGCPLEDISFPEFSLYDTSESYIVFRCTGVSTNTHKTIPPGVYVICNLSATEYFRAEVENELLWNKTYISNYGPYSSELQPSDYISFNNLSKLVFSPESGDKRLYFEFELDYDSQGESVVTDSNGTGEYNLSLDFSEDFNSVVVSLKSLSGFNLEPWGGTADGTLTAEYQIP